MKRFLVFTLLLVVTLCVASIAFASTNHSLPSEIESYFSAGDSTILDYADLTGHGADDCWFVIIRTKERLRFLMKQHPFRSWRFLHTEPWMNGMA